MNPVTAVGQPDPYPYYAELVAHRPGYLDDELNALVLSSARLIRSALAEPALRVRPVDQPVPAGIVDTPAGTVFGQLIRMTDGPAQQRLKGIVGTALDTLDEAAVRQLAMRTAADLLDRSGSLDDLLFQLPVRVVAGLCGLTDGAEAEAARLTGDFVQCLPANATAGQQAGAAVAAEQLQKLLAAQPDAPPSLLTELARAAGRANWPDAAALLANAVGLLSQTYDATAALIANTLVALQREAHPGRQGVPGGDLVRFVREVARHDSPVHNTRRFAAEPVSIGNQQVRQGQSVLLVLAAANRDPAVNPEPAEFRPDRRSPVLFTFGSAGHACPGARLALNIAAGAVAGWLAAGFEPALLDAVGYRPSANIRCPQLQLNGRPR